MAHIVFRNTCPKLTPRGRAKKLLFLQYFLDHVSDPAWAVTDMEIDLTGFEPLTSCYWPLPFYDKLAVVVPEIRPSDEDLHTVSSSLEAQKTKP